MHQIYLNYHISRNLFMCHPLHNHRSRRPASIANRCNSILSGEQLMQERSQDSRPGAAESMSQRDSPAEGIDVCG